MEYFGRKMLASKVTNIATSRRHRVKKQTGPVSKSGAAPLELAGGKNRQAPPQGVKIENDD